MSDITIYHNPACGTSRNVLALIRNSGEEPKVIEYLKTPPDRATLVGLIQAMGMPVRDVLRQKGTPYDELGLGEPLAISAAHGQGVKALIELALEGLEDEEEEDQLADGEHIIKLAVAGRPNVGKSTLINAWLGEERLVAFDMPGTTRDEIGRAHV